MLLIQYSSSETQEQTVRGGEGKSGSSEDVLAIPLGAPYDNFRKTSVQKTIWDLEFSEHLLFNFLLACLS